jgi:hypothetical protein
MVQTRAFLANMPVEPTMAADSLWGMVTSFIIQYPNTEKSARRNPQATMLASFLERQQVAQDHSFNFAAGSAHRRLRASASLLDQTQAGSQSA